MTPQEKLKNDKLKSIKNALKKLEKDTKVEGVAILGNQISNNVQVISTGALMLDIALGVGGVPRGRIVELFGAESSGKSLIATKIAAQCQQEGGIVAIVDMEQTFDPAFAKKLGFDANREDVIFSQPEHLQQAFEVIDALIDAGVDLIILDSVAALVPEEELNGEIGKQTIGLVARYMSQFLRRIGPKLNKAGCTAIFINQVRDAIGVMYGDPTTTPGGKALKFYSSVRMRIARVGSSNVNEKIGGEDITVGHSIRATVVKNKVAPPFRKAEFQIFYDGRKMDKVDELAGVALIKGLIPKYDAKGNLSPTGRTYKWASCPEFLAKAKGEVADELRKYPQVQEELLQKIKEGATAEEIYAVDTMDSDMTEEEFEEQMKRDAEAIAKGEDSEAEEVEDGGWGNL